MKLLKYTLGLPFLLLLTITSIFINFIIYSMIVLPLNTDEYNSEHFKDTIEKIIELWL